ncbi:hypothetical protein [Aeromonas enteropelogenes]|uniref:hypothetical protein n=1 Tax=Aeromonas enteropelogenes TaxID=29489 RepID=UPI0039885AB0
MQHFITPGIDGTKGPTGARFRTPLIICCLHGELAFCCLLPDRLFTQQIGHIAGKNQIDVAI